MFVRMRVPAMRRRFNIKREVLSAKMNQRKIPTALAVPQRDDTPRRYRKASSCKEHANMLSGSTYDIQTREQSSVHHIT